MPGISGSAAIRYVMTTAGPASAATSPGNRKNPELSVAPVEIE
jgi:hypothetical protein